MTRIADGEFRSWIKTAALVSMLVMIISGSFCFMNELEGKNASQFTRVVTSLGILFGLAGATLLPAFRFVALQSFDPNSSSPEVRSKLAQGTGIVVVR